jgi:hypothetical protein
MKGHCTVPADSEENVWKYERGDGRFKHRWDRPYAGFVPGSKGQVGKCSCKITQSIAEKILNQGIPLPVDEMRGETYPKKMYCVHEGVIYEAVPTTPGISYHGYPWRGDLKGRTPIPRWIMRTLRKMAEQQGFAKEFRAWEKKYAR